MSNRNVAKWVEINLGDATNGGSDTILRYSLAGADVLHDGNIFAADGNLVNIGDIESPLGFKKTKVTIGFNSTNLTNVAHFNALKYRNRSVKIWIARRDPTTGGLIASTIQEVFDGQCDSHKVNRRTISLTAKTEFARFEQKSGSRTSSEAQKYNIERGAYDVATSTVDKGFDFASKDFGDITLGKVPARTVTHSQQVYNGKRGGFFGTGSKKYDTVTTSEYIPGRTGDVLGDDGSDYTRPLIYGRASPTGNLIYAFNPLASRVASVYSDLSNATIIKDVTDSTRYVTMLFAVAEGELNDISVLFKGVAGTTTSTTILMQDGGQGVLKLGSETIGVVEVKTGKYNQTAFSNLVSLSDDWTNDHRCIGTALVMITLAASSAFSAGFPDFTINVGGKKYQTVTSGGVLSSSETSGNTNTNSSIFSLITAESSTTLTIPNGSSPVSASPAFAVLDILMSDVYGLGISSSKIDLQSFRDAFDNEQDTSSAQVGTYATTCRGVLEGSRSYKQLIDSLLLTAKANLTVINGKITIISNKYLGTDAATIASSPEYNASNTINGVENINFSPSTQVYNQITMTCPVTNVPGVDVYSLNVLDANALAEDNNQKSEKAITLNMASVQLDSNSEPEDSSKEILEEIGRAALRRSRLFVRGTMSLDYWDNSTMKPGDVIVINSKRFNLTGSGKILAKVTRIVFRGLGVMKIEWQQYSNLIWDISATDITTVTRGVYPTTSFNTPDNYDYTGETGDTGATGESGISNRLDISYAPNSDGSGGIFPTGLLTGSVQAIKIVLADAADSTSDEIFLKQVIGTTDNHFLKNTGTSVGHTLSFFGATSNGATPTVARLGFNQPANTTVEAQVDAMITDFNTIPLLGAGTAATIGTFSLQRNSIAVKIDEESFYLLRLTNDIQTTAPTFVVSQWNGGTPTVTNASIIRNTYDSAKSRITDVYLGDRLVTWEKPEAEPAVSSTITDYVWTKVKGDAGATGDSPFSIYRVSTSLPDTPTGGSYNSTTDILTPPSGWHNTVAAAKAAIGAGKLYQANARYLFRTETLTVWEDPFDVGQGAPQLTDLDVRDKGRSGNNKIFDIVSTLTTDEGNTSTVTSNEFGLPDVFSGLSDVAINTSASTDMALIWDASSDNVQQISFKDIVDSGKSTSELGYIPEAPGSNGTYTLTKDGSTFSWAADATGNIPTLPTTNGAYHLVRLNGVYSWAVDAEGYLPNAGPTSDGSYNLKRASGVLTWEADGAGGIPTIPSGISTNSEKSYNLRLTDVSGVETATWVEDTNIGYFPVQPANNKKYVLDISSVGVVTWKEVQGDFLPDSPSVDILVDKQYQLKVDQGSFGTNPVTSWVAADALPTYIPNFQPFANGKYRLSTNNGGITMFWEDDEIPDAPGSNGEYSLKINGSSITWATAGANGVTLPSTNGEYALSRAGAVFSYFAPDSFKLPDLPTGNGDYVLKRLSGSWTWVDESGALSLPDEPSSNGVFSLTVSGGNSTWTEQTGTLSLPSIPTGNGEYNLKVNSSIGSWELDASGDDNVQSDWSEETDTEDSFIKNKPTTITAAQTLAITANTSKVGITPAQALAITANTSKVGITPAQTSAISTNTSKVGITSAQALAITANTSKVGFTQSLARTALDISNTNTVLTYKDKLGATKTFEPIGTGEDNVQSDWSETTTTDDSFIKNKPTTITPAQTSAISTNTSKVGITSAQALAITANTSKVGFTTVLAQDALDISDDGSILTYKNKTGVTKTFEPDVSGEDNVQSDWSETTTDDDSFIKNKPTTITAAQTLAISTNTSKVGITSAQALAITANTSKVGITPAQALAITANTSKVGFTTVLAQDALDISDDGSILTYKNKTGVTKTFEPSSSGEANVQSDWSETTTDDDSFIKNKPTTITAAQTLAITANTSKRSYPSVDEAKLGNIPTLPAGIAEDTSKDYILKLTDVSGNETLTWGESAGGGGSGEDNVQSDWSEVSNTSDSFIKNKPTTITAAQTSAISTNTSKVGITPAQALAITANTSKVGFTTALARDAVAISDSENTLTYTDASDNVQTWSPTGTGGVNVQSDWSETTTTDDSFIKNKPTTITAAQTLAITANTSKVGITPAQALAITSNTSKVGFTNAAAQDALDVSDDGSILTYKDKSGVTQTFEPTGGGSGSNVPDFPTGLTTDTAKSYNLKVTDASGTETATWEEDTGGGGGSGEANVQSDWSETTTNDDSFIKNKPTTITPAQTSAITANTNKTGFTNTLAQGALSISDSNGVLTYTDSSGTTQTFEPTGGGGSSAGLPLEVKTSTFTAVSNMIYVVEPESEVIITLPESPTLGNRIIIADSNGVSDLFNITVLNLVKDNSQLLIISPIYNDINYTINRPYEVLELYFDGKYWTRSSNFPNMDKPDEVSVTLPDTFNSGTRDTPSITLDVAAAFGFHQLFGFLVPTGWSASTNTSTLPTGWDYTTRLWEGDVVDATLTNNTGASVTVSEISITLDNFTGFSVGDPIQINADVSGASGGSFSEDGISSLLSYENAPKDFTGPVTFTMYPLDFSGGAFDIAGGIEVAVGELISLSVQVNIIPPDSSRTLQITDFSIRTSAEMPSFLRAEYIKTGQSDKGVFIGHFLDGDNATEVLTDLGSKIRDYNGKIVKVGDITSTTLADGITSAKTLKLKMPRATVASEYPLTYELEVNRGTGTTGTTVTSLRGIPDTDDSVAQEFQRSLQPSGQKKFTVTLTPTSSIGNFDNFIITDDGSNMFRVYGPHPNAGWTDKDGVVDGVAPAVGAPRYRAAIVGIATPATGTDAEKQASIAADLATILPAFFATAGGGSLTVSVTSLDNSIILVADSFGTVALSTNTGNWAGKVAFTQPVDNTTLMPTPNQVFGVGQMVTFLGDAYIYLGTDTLTTLSSSTLPSSGGGWKKLT